MSAALETEDELPSPVSASSDCGSVPAVSVSEAGVTSPVLERGAGHQGPAEAGTVPLGLVAAPAPALCRGQDSSAHRGGRHPVLGQFCSGLGGWSLPRDGGRSG